MPGGQATPARHAGPGVVYVQITTPLEGATRKSTREPMRTAIGSVPGMRTYLTGFPALSHDGPPSTAKTSPGRVDRDPDRDPGRAVLHVRDARRRGVPFIFAFATLPTTLGLVWVIAHLGNMAEYVTNIVTLIGLAIAIDYSMLVVFRYREQLDGGEDPADALETTMATAGSATLFSGLTVAIGLALLLAHAAPVHALDGRRRRADPAGLDRRLATLLPALLSVIGRAHQPLSAWCRGAAGAAAPGGGARALVAASRARSCAIRSRSSAPRSCSAGARGCPLCVCT